jgi:hypothetical protein
MTLNAAELKQLKVWGHAITKRYNIFPNRKSKQDKQSPTSCRELLCYIYDKKFLLPLKIPKERVKKYQKMPLTLLTPQLIKDTLDEKWWYDKLIHYTQKEIFWEKDKKTGNYIIQPFMIWGHQIIQIVKSYGFETKYLLRSDNPIWFKEFVSNVYDKDFMLLTKDSIEKYFMDIWYDKLLNYKEEDIKSIKIWIYNMSDIPNQYWFKSRYNLNRYTPIWFKEFICFLFDKKFKYEKKEKEKITIENVF